MRHLLLALLFAVMVAFVVAHKPRSLDPQAYVNWVRDPGNGWNRVVETGGFKIECQLKPQEYVKIVEWGPDEALWPEAGNVDRSEEDNVDAYQFTLRFRPVGGNEFLSHRIKAQDEYYSRLRYFTDAVEGDLSLLINGDTLPCAVSHFARYYGAAPYDDLLLSFVGDGCAQPGTSNVQLAFDDHVLGLGRVVFDFRREDLSALPTLKQLDHVPHE